MRAAGRVHIVSLPALLRGRLTLLCLGLCFAAGLYLGQVFSGKQSGVVAPELTQYLSGYLSLSPEVSLSAETFLISFLVYFRYPLLAFLLGFASFGILLLPVLSAGLAFSLSYAVCCFSHAFGSKGVLLALTLLGVRCFVTLPCYFVLAAQSFETSRALARFAFGRGKRAAPVSFGSPYFFRFLICCAALAAGAVLDIWLTPWLLRLVSGGLT